MQESFDIAVDDARRIIRKLMTLQLGHFTNDSNNSKKVEEELELATSAVQNVSNIISDARGNSGMSKHVLDKWKSILDELESKLKGAINRHAYISSKDANTSNFASNQVNSAAQAIQDAELVELGMSIDGIQSLASAVNKEVYTQKDMLSNLDEKLNINSTLLDSLIDRMSGYLRTKDPALIRLVFYLVCLSSFLVFLFLLI